MKILLFLLVVQSINSINLFKNIFLSKNNSVNFEYKNITRIPSVYFTIDF